MDFEPFLRVLIAAALSLPIGLDRELRGKSAGLRTHVVVATAAAALGYVSLLAAPASMTGADGTRIASQVVSGIGFMGAGVIFASQGRVHGLTTAAALFSAAAVGLCVGLGAVTLGLALVLVTVLFLWPVDLLSNRLIGGFALEERVLHIVTRQVDTLGRVQRLLGDLGLAPREVHLETFDGGVSARIVVRCRRDALRRILQDLDALEGVTVISDEAVTVAD